MSKTASIWAYLADGHTLTAATAAKKFNCYAMHSRASELRARGHDIVCKALYTASGRIWQYSMRKRA